MTSDQLKKLFRHYTEDAQFLAWSKAQPPGMQFVFACEYSTFWKFTLREWWQFVARVVHNNGGHDLVLSKALHSRPGHISKGEDNKFHSSDVRFRCVNPLDWTLLDWTNELEPGRGVSGGLDQIEVSLRKPQRSESAKKSASKIA